MTATILPIECDCVPYVPPTPEQADSAPQTIRMDADTSAAAGDLVRLDLTRP